MKPRFYQHPSHGRLSAARANGRTLFPLSGITGIHQIKRFGPDWLASYADKHPIPPVKTKDGRDRLLDEITVLDFIGTLIDDVDLVDWLINRVIKDLHGIKEPRLAGSAVAADSLTDKELLSPTNSVSTWLLHPLLAPDLGYRQWIQSLARICTTPCQKLQGIRIGRRLDGTIAINPMLALGLAMEDESSPAMMVFQNHGGLPYHESLTTFDSIFRRHSVMNFRKNLTGDGWAPREYP